MPALVVVAEVAEGPGAAALEASQGRPRFAPPLVKAPSPEPKLTSPSSSWRQYEWEFRTERLKVGDVRSGIPTFVTVVPGWELHVQANPVFGDDSKSTKKTANISDLSITIYRKSRAHS